MGALLSPLSEKTRPSIPGSIFARAVRPGGPDPQPLSRKMPTWKQKYLLSIFRKSTICEKKTACRVKTCPLKNILRTGTFLIRGDCLLTLPITKEWFDKILAGKKKEEYRVISPYYDSRLSRFLGDEIEIILRNGYRSTSPAVLVTVKVLIGLGRPEWGAEESELYYVLEIIKVTRIR